ncbi:uncharacterized protein LOC111249559 [Varroa destructor]|uniref:Uncharacterized protein n=1 Tax=Varroa destructor TaxID=109461 RepID=A0A7M7K8D3_VARDE|nr:uncharacterized protein LOC111249559 [Varroa destructor]
MSYSVTFKESALPLPAKVRLLGATSTESISSALRETTPSPLLSSSSSSPPSSWAIQSGSSESIRRRSLICSGGSSPTANDEAGPTGKTSPIVKRNWRSYETELEVAAFVLADAANDPVLVMMLVIILITLVFLVTLAIRTRMYTDRLEAVYMKLPPNPHETTVLSFKKFH